MSAVQVGVDKGVHPSQDFKTVVQPRGTPSWRLVRTYMQSGQTAPAFSRTSQSQLIFEIPASVVNLSRSWLRFNIAVAAPAAGVWPFQAANRLPFQSVKLYTRSGTYLMNIDSNCAKWSQTVRPLRTSYKTFKTNDSCSTGGLAANAPYPVNGDYSRECLCPNNVPSSDPYAMTAFQTAAAGNQPAINYDEILYINGPSADGTATTRQFNINLGKAFPETILGMDKDIWWGGQVMLLEFDVEPLNNFMWTTASGADAATGAIAGTTAITTSNLWLDLAYQDNKDIAADVITEFSKGVSLYIPYTQLFKYPTQAGTSFSQPINLNSGYGRTLMAMRVVFQNTTENFALAQDNSNIAGSKVVSFQSQLDSQLLQPYLVDCAGTVNYDDWELMQPQLRGTPLGLCRYTYQTNWIWSDDFSGRSPVGDEKGVVPSENIIGGILLTQENKVYTFTATTANAAYNVYYMALFLKKLVIHAGGNIEVS